MIRVPFTVRLPCSTTCVPIILLSDVIEASDETPNVCISPWERSFVLECSLWYELVDGVINVCFELFPICSNRLCFRTGCFELLKALL